MKCNFKLGAYTGSSTNIFSGPELEFERIIFYLSIELPSKTLAQRL